MVEIRPYSATSFQRNIAYLKISYITAFDTINQPKTDLVPSLAECSVALGCGDGASFEGGELAAQDRLRCLWLEISHRSLFSISLAGAINAEF